MEGRLHFNPISASIELSACDPVGNCSATATATAATLFEHDADFGDVVINELMWMGMNGVAGDEWLELRNMTDQEVDLSDWQLTKKRTGDGVEVAMFTFPSGTTIVGGGYLLVAEYDKDNSGLNVEPNLAAGTGSDNNSDFALANSDLQIRLYDGDFSAGGLLIDTADDGTGTPAAGLAELEGGAVYYSMERNATPGDGSQAASWHTTFADTESFFDTGLTAVKGTPGAVNQSQQQILENSEQKTNQFQNSFCGSGPVALYPAPTSSPTRLTGCGRSSGGPSRATRNLESFETGSLGVKKGEELEASPSGEVQSFPSVPDEIASGSPAFDKAPAAAEALAGKSAGKAEVAK